MKSLTLTQKSPIWTQLKILNFDDFCYKFEENFAEIDKIGDISKFEILNPKIQNLKSLTLKSKIFNFDKIWPKIKIPPRWFIVTLWSNQNFNGQNFPKICPNMGATIRYKDFSKILKSISKSPNSSKIGSHHQNFEGKFLKPMRRFSKSILSKVQRDGIPRSPRHSAE